MSAKSHASASASHHPQPKSHSSPPSSSSTKPHALQSFSSIASTLQGKRVALFLDYDGTLTPIVSDPSAARITPEMTATIATLSARHPTAIVTGRKIDTIRGFLTCLRCGTQGRTGLTSAGRGGGRRSRWRTSSWVSWVR